MWEAVSIASLVSKWQALSHGWQSFMAAGGAIASAVRDYGPTVLAAVAGYFLLRVSKVVLLVFKLTVVACAVVLVLSLAQ